MARSISFRTFSDNGSEVMFSSLLFRRHIREWRIRESEKKNERITLDVLFNRLAVSTGVSLDAVRNWDKGVNGVSDLEIVKNLAREMGIDYHDLVVKKNEIQDRSLNENFEPVSSYEKDLLNQIYQLFIDYIYWFIGTISYCRATVMLEDPWKEHQEYIINLYHYLDRISLLVSEDTYSKLRKTISELEYIKVDYRISIGHFSDEWIEVNPILNSDAFFYMINSFEIEDVLDVIHSEEIVHPEIVLHHVIEDVPHIIRKFNPEMRENGDNKIDSSHSISTEDTEEDKDYELFHQMVPEEFANKVPGGDYYPMAHAFGEMNGFSMPIYAIISREVSKTLRLVMRKRFPQYFGDKEIK